MPACFPGFARLGASLALAFAAPAFASDPPAAARPATVAGASASYVYESVRGTDLTLDVVPAAGGPGPHAAILLFFGGAWTTGNPAQFAPEAAYLAQRGMTVVLPDYRTIGRDHATPFDSMADAAAAMRWVRAHAAQLGIDAHRIAAGGGSAGGHLALTTAVLPSAGGPASPDALVLFNPVVDTSSWTKQFGSRAPDAAPLLHIHAGLPPTLILHGRADTTAPFAQVEAYCSAVRRNGDRCEVVGFDGAGHGFFNPVHGGGPGFEGSMREAARFLGELGYLAPH